MVPLQRGGRDCAAQRAPPPQQSERCRDGGGPESSRHRPDRCVRQQRDSAQHGDDAAATVAALVLSRFRWRRHASQPQPPTCTLASREVKNCGSGLKAGQCCSSRLPMPGSQRPCGSYPVVRDEERKDQHAA